MSDDNYGNLDDIDIHGEADVETSSEDFFEGNVPPAPGWYLSRQREVQPNKVLVNPKTKALQFRLDFGENGLSHKDTGEEVRWPPFAYIDTEMRDVFRGTGKASSVGRYLKACGFDARVMDSAALKTALRESQGMPVMVEIEWEDDYRDREPGPNGEKPKAVYTKAFKVGDQYLPQVTLPDGRKVKAVARIRNYKKVE